MRPTKRIVSAIALVTLGAAVGFVAALLRTRNLTGTPAAQAPASMATA